MPNLLIQQKIDTLSQAVARGELIDADLNVVSKHGWKWRILSCIKVILQPIFSCFGYDLFSHYRVNAVALSVLQLCQKEQGLDIDCKARVVTHILIPLDAKTKGKYSKDISQIKNTILGVGGADAVVTDNKKRVQNAMQQFAHQLHQRLAQNSATSICFSPLSLAPILGMILKGMPPERKELFLNFLGLKDLPESLIHLSLNEIIADLQKASGTVASLQITNGLAASDTVGISDAYRQDIVHGYQANSFSISKDPEAAAKTINDWVFEKTNGQIKDLVSAEDLRNEEQNPFFALLNAIYFEGKWQNKFDPAVKGAFRFASGNTEQVQMMQQTKHLQGYDGDTFRMIELPYNSPEDHHFAHLVFLPNEGQPLNALEARLNPEFIAQCRHAASGHKYHVTMPKIDVTVRSDHLFETLNTMGVPLKGFFPYIGKDMELKKIIHQAKVKVDEVGTVAAAATGVIFATKSAPPRVEEIREFRIDRDYIYYIVDADQILFQGNIKDPAALTR